MFKKKRDSQRPNFHIAFLLVLNNFFYVAFKYAERTEFGVHLIELLNNITFDGLKAILSWFNKFQFEFWELSWTVLTVSALSAIFPKNWGMGQALEDTICKTCIAHVLQTRKDIQFGKISICTRHTCARGWSLWRITSTFLTSFLWLLSGLLLFLKGFFSLFIGLIELWRIADSLNLFVCDDIVPLWQWGVSLFIVWELWFAHFETFCRSLALLWTFLWFWLFCFL